MKIIATKMDAYGASVFYTIPECLSIELEIKIDSLVLSFIDLKDIKCRLDYAICMNYEDQFAWNNLQNYPIRVFDNFKSAIYDCIYESIAIDLKGDFGEHCIINIDQGVNDWRSLIKSDLDDFDLKNPNK